MTQAQEIGCSRETLLQQTCSKQVPDGVFLHVTLGGSQSIVNAPHDLTQRIAWRIDESKNRSVKWRRWPHMTTFSSDSTRRRVWKTLHSGDAMPRKPLENSKRKHSPVGLEWPLDMYWRLLSAVFWDRESPYSNARSKSHRFSQWRSVQVSEPLSGVGPVFRRCSFTLYIFETCFAAPSFSRSLFVTFKKRSNREILMQYASRYE